MTPAELRAFITSRLDPIEAYDPAARPVITDFDPIAPAPGAPAPAIAAAAVLVPLVERETGLTILLTRRSDSLRSHTGQVAFPGGRSEPGERPWETALREAHEEIGLEADFVTLAGLASDYRTISSFDITPVVAFVRPGFTLTPSPAEVADIFETPFDFVMDLMNHQRRYRDLDDGRRRHFYAIPFGEQLIWGATAAMLRQLRERLYGPSEDVGEEMPA
jgi:8-oxo-dGTP pyrophosphatase MutT (NUDIX family)